MGKRSREYWGPTAVPRIRRGFIRGMQQWVSEIEVQKAAESPPVTQGEREHWESREASLLATRTAISKLDLAHLFWVTEDMAVAAMDASHDIPSVQWASVLPANAGIIGFAKALPPLPENLQMMYAGDRRAPAKPIDMISWHYGKNGLSINAHTLVSRYAPGEIPDELDTPGPLMHSMAFVLPHADREVAFNSSDWATVTDSSILTETAHTEYIGAQPAGDAMLAFLAACLTMMMQPTVATRTRLDGTTGGPARDAAPATPSDVTLIDLRPLVHKATETEPGEGARVYRHRWIVRGHWRNQRVGQDRAQTRVTWVPSHIKGPAGAPVLATEKVMVWRR